MSAEAPRNSGQGEPIHPQRPDGGFSGFFKRLFAVPSEPQPAHQTTSRIVQPLPGLEDFAAGLKQGIDNHFASVRQQELDRQNAEALRRSAEAARKAQEETKQRELADQERVRREKAIAEANKMLENYRIRERLEHIRDTVWEGKGQVKPLEPSSNLLGGFELVHEYPSFTKQEEEIPLARQKGYNAPNYRWRYVPRTDSVHLRIAALGNSRLSIYSNLVSDRFEENPPYSGVFNKSWGWQDDPRRFGYSTSHIDPAFVQMDLPESERLLQEVITQVVVDRIKRGVLPAQLEKESQRQLSHLPSSPQGWQKWNTQYVPKMYHEQHPYDASRGE